MPGHITLLIFDHTEEGYQLCARKKADKTIFARENADKTWSVESDGGKNESLRAKYCLAG